MYGEGGTVPLMKQQKNYVVGMELSIQQSALTSLSVSPLLLTLDININISSATKHQ